MNKDIIILYIRKLQRAILVLIVGLVMFGLGVKSIIPKVESFVGVNKNIKKQTKSVEENTKKLVDLKASTKSKVNEQKSLQKEFYKPIESGLDAEAVMSEEFGDVLKMIRDNSIKTRAVKYDYNPSSDKFVKNAGTKYNVCTVSLEMIADYKHFQAFLRDLYKHEHFLEISDVEIIPYEKDKKILLIKSNLKLYSQKSEAEIAAAKAAAPQEGNPAQSGAEGAPMPGGEPAAPPMPPSGDVPVDGEMPPAP